MLSLLFHIKRINAQKKVETISRFFGESEKVLDFGCGDLSLAHALSEKLPKIKITGVDVIDIVQKKNSKNVNFVKYDGSVLPFSNDCFDTVIAYFVFHHCQDSIKALKECIRVSKKNLIIVEALYRNKWEIPFMKFIDILTNFWKSKEISMPYNYFSEYQWLKLFKTKDLVVYSEERIKSLLSVFPFGEGIVFKLVKKRHEIIS